jgi:hypothetical protein
MLEKCEKLILGNFLKVLRSLVIDGSFLDPANNRTLKQIFNVSSSFSSFNAVRVDF